MAALREAILSVRGNVTIAAMREIDVSLNRRASRFSFLQAAARRAMAG